MSEPQIRGNSKRRRERDTPAPEPSAFNLLLGLSCGHTARSSHPVLPGEDWFCRRCNRTTVIELIPEEWSVRCRTCSYARQYGAAKLKASFALDGHLRRFQARGELHTADLFHGAALQETRRATQPASLFDASNEPPF